MRALAFLIGLSTTAVFCPAFMRASVDPKWAVLAGLIPLACLFVKVRWTAAHSWLLAFVGWSILSLAWTPGRFEGVLEVWHLVLLFGAFLIGASRETLVPASLGMAIGLVPNALIVLWQHADRVFGGLGLRWFEAHVFDFFTFSLPGALMVNANYLGEAGALGTVLALGLPYRWKWWLVPFPAVCAAASLSKGAWLALSLTGALWLWRRPGYRLHAAALILAVLAAGAAYFLWRGPESVQLSNRIALWANTLVMLADPVRLVFGWGAGSYAAVYPDFVTAWLPSPHSIWNYNTYPQNAHSDILTVLAQHGMVGLGLLVLFALSLRAAGPPAYALASFVFLGLANFPAYGPHAVVVAALVAGVCARAVPRPVPGRGAYGHGELVARRYGIP